MCKNNNSIDRNLHTYLKHQIELQKRKHSIQKLYLIYSSKAALQYKSFDSKDLANPQVVTLR